MFKKIAITLGIIVVVGIAVVWLADESVIKTAVQGVWTWIFVTMFKTTAPVIF